MTTLYIVRHAEAEGNLYRRAHGWYDGHITPNGLRQIEALAGRFDGVHIDVAYSSDLQRTKLTAGAVTEARGLPLRLDPDLREIGLGIYENMPFGQLRHFYPQESEQFFLCSPQWSSPEGETFQQVTDRILSAITRIAQAHPGESVAIFTHSIAIRCLQSALRGVHPSETTKLGLGENTAITKLEYENGTFRTVYENDDAHVPAEIATQAKRKLQQSGERPMLEVWFRSLDMDSEAQIYADARLDAWLDIHHTLDNFDGPGFLAEAREQWTADRRAVQCVMWQDEVIGVLQLATHRQIDDGVGYIPFVYLKPDYRRRGIGSQLIGEAVSLYRELGRRTLRLRCAPDNLTAQRFYKRLGFQKIGMAPGARVPLELLSLDI